MRPFLPSLLLLALAGSLVAAEKKPSVPPFQLPGRKAVKPVAPPPAPAVDAAKEAPVGETPVTPEAAEPAPAVNVAKENPAGATPIAPEAAEPAPAVNVAKEAPAGTTPVAPEAAAEPAPAVNVAKENPAGATPVAPEAAAEPAPAPHGDGVPSFALPGTSSREKSAAEKKPITFRLPSKKGK